jgi:hypothetical protein
MARHLSAAEAERALNAGRSIEQWLGARVEGADRVLKWVQLTVEKDGGGYSVTVFEVLDDGGPEFLDVYEFSPLDADQPYGVTTTLKDARGALEFAIGAGADPCRFVNAGIVQDEYADYLSSRS